MAPPSSAGALEVALTIHGLTSSGDGVGRLADGRVAFVRGGLPGDQVEARITEEQERLVKAETMRLVVPSPRRVASTCLREGCGGCALRDYDVEAQRAAKVDQVLQAMIRIAKLDAKPVFRGMSKGAPWRYRHRARLHVRYDGQWRLGYHARGSHELVDFAACPVLWPELESSARDLGAWLAGQPRSLGLREVEIAYSRRDGRAAAVFIGAQEPREAPIGDATLRYDHAGDFTLRFTAGVFTQANPEMNEQLVAAVCEAVRGERVLELHSGIGNFSLPLASQGHNVRAVEESPAASALAKRNAEGFTVTAVSASDHAAIADADRFDTVLVDPPRIGAREVATRLAQRGPTRIVYVSCDPATLARDVRLVVDGGYRLDALSTCDMVPQPPHGESLAVLTR
jgi:23S rRNA (uracil1939-C5)-methyltransferase